jgi:hypothetical protein
MRAFAVRRGETHGDLAGRILCHDVAGVFRKGHVLRADDIPLLIDASWSEVHLLELDDGDVAQREAGERLAEMLANASLHAAPAGHRHVLKAKQNGLLKIDTGALQRINAIPGLAVFTLPNDRVVSKDEVVVEAQITPLAIARSALDHAARERSVIRVLPFVPCEVVVWKRDDRLLRALSGKLHWFGCEMRDSLDLPRDAPSIRASMERRTETLFIVSGSNALDPLDPVFTALEQLGATMQRIGMPVHPGTLLWIASWRNTTIIGLPSCGLGPQMTAFDLVLPKLLAEGRIADEELAALGHGGILRRHVIPSAEEREESGRWNHASAQIPRRLRGSE